jgi:hypothetical protein
MARPIVSHIGRGKANRPKLTKVFSQWEDAGRTKAFPIEINTLLEKMIATPTDKLQVTRWLDLAYPDWRAEGMLEEWWGMGSVFCMELCIQVDIRVDNVDETVTVVLS